LRKIIFGRLKEVAKVIVNKVDAARRQIDLAIRLHFHNEDIVSIHTLASAGFRILRDTAEAKKARFHEDFVQTVIKPGMERQFWTAINRPANFFKHAEIDPDEILENVEETVNDSLLVLCCFWYVSLGYELTPEMEALLRWSMIFYPTMHDLTAYNPADLERFNSEALPLQSESRQAQLNFGIDILNFLLSKRTKKAW
jgi:hypothetical protein